MMAEPPTNFRHTIRKVVVLATSRLHHVIVWVCASVPVKKMLGPTGSMSTKAAPFTLTWAWAVQKLPATVPSASPENVTVYRSESPPPPLPPAAIVVKGIMPGTPAALENAAFWVLVKTASWAKPLQVVRVLAAAK